MISMTRNIDEIGRIVIPKKFREVFNMEKNDSIEVVLTSEGILIRKPQYKSYENCDGIADNY